MKSSGLEEEISRGKGLFAEIVRLTSDFLEKFACLEPAGINEFERKRQALLETLLSFHAGLRQKLLIEEKGLSPVVTRQLEEFRIFQEVFVQIIMEKDAAIISEATRSLEKLRHELEVVSRGKQALRGYNRRKSPSLNYLDKTA